MAILVRLDEVMANRKVKLLELADRIGITYANLSNLKNCKVNAIRFSTLESICRELNCQPGDILEYIDDEVLNYIEVFCDSDTKREGVLNRLNAYAMQKGVKTITLELAKECFEFTKKISIELIVQIVAEHFGYEIDNLINDNKYDYFYAKSIALYLCRTETTVSFKEICDFFDIDSEKLISSCDFILEQLPKNYLLKNDYSNILNKLK